MNQVIYDKNQAVENLIEYIKFERATSFEGEVIIPSRKFALKTLIETYSQIDTQQDLVKVMKEKYASEFGEVSA